MAFDRETAATIAPVLTMVGQQAKLDPSWACAMIEAVAGEILPDFYRAKREASECDEARAALDLKLVLASGGRAADIVRLAQTAADAERLGDSLYWIEKAIDADPDNGEYLRFKASILERMRLFDRALPAAREAERRGADPDAIRSDIQRMEDHWLSHLREGARSGNISRSLRSYATLLEQGHVRRSELATVLLRIAGLIIRGARARDNAEQAQNSQC